MLNDYEKARKIAEHLLNVAMHSSKIQDKDFCEWLEENPSAYELMQHLTDSEKIKKLLAEDVDYAPLASAEKLQHEIQRRMFRKRINRLGGVAAIVAVFVGLWLLFQPSDRPVAVNSDYCVNDAPRLILGNGEVIHIDTMQQFENSDVRIVRTGEGELTQLNKQEVGSIDTSKNRLILPSEMRYTMYLPDGSKVILNANSCLTYPNHFSTKERRVEIKGEAFFDVVKDKIPFIVSASGVDIKVYGTRFNVNNFSRDKVETVLVEGEVGVEMLGEEKVRLLSSQRALVDIQAQTVTQDEIDPAKYIAWTEGFFFFDDDDLIHVLQTLSHWFGVRFDVSGIVGTHIPVVARFRQSTPLAEILESLSWSCHIECKMNADGIYLVKQTQ